MKKLNMMSAVIAILFIVTTGWSACESKLYNYSAGSYYGGCNYGSTCQTGPGQVPLCSSVVCDASKCPQSIRVSSGNYYAPETLHDNKCTNANNSCINTNPRIINCTYTLKCDTQREADSTICIRDGNIWQAGTCKINHCKAADSTWLSTSIAACTGSNNYALVNTDSTCEHVGTCCPNDSIPSGNTCKWRCDSVLTTCGNRTGELFGGVLPDTSVSGQDTTFSYQCYYNCSHSPNADSSVYLVEGNIVLSGPNDSIPDGIKSQSTFNSVRTTTGGVYVYDYLSPAASEYIDSIAAMKCVEHLWRCVINNKYVYWYDNQEVPAGCTNIVRVK